MLAKLEGRVAIITGAGRGLGKIFATRFAEEGAKLLLPDISLERSEATAKAIRTKGGQAIAMELDISNDVAVQKMAEMVISQYGKVDILLNNAAMFYGVRHRPWDSWNADEWKQMFAVNVTGTWLCCKAIARLMVKQAKGKIINIASDIIKVPPAHWLLPYSCSKAAVYTLTQCLARALGPSNINVNAIAPGRTATEAGLLDADNLGFEDTIAAQALKRREEPADLAGAAVFLASEDSDFITGQIICVDGGAVMI